MLFELLVLEVTLVDIMPWLLVQVRAINCMVEQLICVYFLDLSILVFLQHPVDLCKPQRKQLCILVA